MTETETRIRGVVEQAARVPGLKRLTDGDHLPEHHRHREGPVAAAIEEYTARIPSDVYLWAAGGSIVASAVLKLTNRPQTALFVGQWVAPFLVLGLYNKLVKVAGTDRVRQPQNPLAGGAA